MPAELRKLIFSEAELRAAMVNFALRNDMRVPAANIDKVDIDDEEDLTITLCFTSDDPAKDKDLVFNKEQIMAGVILYCRNYSIPLPRVGRKVLAKDGNTVTMMINMRWPPKKEK